jgi:RNA polymerase sigma-70 factor, ECF subfamily
MFEEMLRPELRPLYAFVYTLVHDRDATEDVVQIASLKAWKHFGSFDQNKNFKTWLFAIGKNSAFDYLKKKKTIPFSAFQDDDESPLEKVVDESILPDEVLERADIREAMTGALLEIGEKYRVVLELVYREDFSLKEVAEILGESYNTVKSKHQRGIQALRGVLADEAR